MKNIHIYHAEITATSGLVVVISLRRIGARGAQDVTRAPYWGPRGARCDFLNTIKSKKEQNVMIFPISKNYEELSQ